MDFKSHFSSAELGKKGQSLLNLYGGAIVPAGQSLGPETRPEWTTLFASEDFSQQKWSEGLQEKPTQLYMFLWQTI